MKTRADVLRFQIEYALQKTRVKMRGAIVKLDEATRRELADDVIRSLQRYGQWKELDAPLADVSGAPYDPEMDKRESAADAKARMLAEDQKRKSPP